MLTRYLKPDLVIIDDFGMKQLPKRSGEYLFEIIMRRTPANFPLDVSVLAGMIFPGSTA